MQINHLLQFNIEETRNGHNLILGRREIGRSFTNINK
jgi:hypothetical protein